MSIVIRPVLPPTTQADSGTTTILISDNVKAHGFLLEITNVGGATAGLNITDMISNIQLLKNGSEQIVYGSANALRSIAHDVGVKCPNEIYNLAGGATQTMVIPILFGDDLIDPNHYLDLSQISLLQLIITYAFTIAVTGFTTGTASFALYGIYEYDQPMGAYQGYIHTKQADSYAAAASGNHTTLLPTTTQLSSVHLISNTYAGDISTPIGNILYRANQGQRIFWNDTAARLRRYTQMLSPAYPWLHANAFVAAIPNICSFFHSVGDNESLDLTPNEYSMLELVQTNQSATGTVLVMYRELVQ
ncbi:MAG: hypothetical protein ABSB40_12805 [Nitrososphaeria archaeon]|jgi:hypothetical protein